MKRLHRTQLLSVLQMLGNRVHFPVMNNVLSDSLAKGAVVSPRGRCGDVEYLGRVLSVEVQMWGCRSLPLGDSSSSVWLPKRDHLYCGNHSLLKLGAAEVVKGAPVVPFGVSRFHLLGGLGIAQAEPSPARREVQEDHGRHGALPCSLWKEFKKRQTQMYVGSVKWCG